MVVASLSFVRPYFLVLLGACDLSAGERASTGACPEATCSVETPGGLHFYGEAISEHDDLDGLLGQLGPAATAVGGHQGITIAGLDELPYTATANATSGGIDVVSTSGDVVTIDGVASGRSYLRIAEPDTDVLYDRIELEASAITHISFEPIELEAGQEPWAFLAGGDVNVAIALFGMVTVGSEVLEDRIVDSALAIQLPAGASRTAWDAITFAAPGIGTHSLTVTAGDQPPVQIAFDVVDHIDAILPYEPPTQITTSDWFRTACFIATSGARAVAGLAWTFEVDGAAASPFPVPNCVPFYPSEAGATIHISARTMGLDAAIAVPVVAGAARTEAPRYRPSAAGERASLVMPNPRSR
jgi:hypothetical protein